MVKIEQKLSENPHFHARMFVDGSKVKDQKKYCEIGDELLEQQLEMNSGAADGLIQYATPKRKKKINH